MRCRIAGLLTGLTLALAGPAIAEEVSTAGEAAEETPLARVVTSDNLPHECLAPIVITRVDGKRQAVPSQGFSMVAGPHRLNGRAVLDTEKCRPLEMDQYIPPATDLSMDFATGTTYHIAYDRSHLDSSQWRLVVWKVEQEPVLGAGDKPLANPESVQ
jgi:hypothetical protein